jgi:hypothetical protein
MSWQGIVGGVLAGGVVTAVISLIWPKSHLGRIGAAVLGVGVAYLVMRLV